MFSFIQDAIGGIISQILSQFNFIQDLITTPLKAIVNQVVQGVWKGNGANKFVSEMTDQVIPMIGSILTGTQNYANSIKKSQDHMLQGFQQASSIANSLNDVFNNIF
jgi:phage-related protein